MTYDPDTWIAVLADADGYVYPDYATALDELGEDYGDNVEIAIVRRSAAPIGEGDDRRFPGSWNSADRAAEWECYLVDPDGGAGAEEDYARAIKMAAGLNGKA